MAIKLLIVDDSAFMRKIVSDSVKRNSEIEVVGIARNGLDALEAIPKLQPDIITLDIEMPKLNGIETLKRIKENYNIPVIMLSSHSGTDITIEALQIGALDFIEKPSNLNADLTNFQKDLCMKITSVIKAPNIKAQNIQERFQGRYKRPVENTIKKEMEIGKEPKDIEAVVIGASTGGPKALVYLISKLPQKINIPIFIVQHMPKDFTTSFAARLDKESRIKVVEAEDGVMVEKGTVYLAPGDYHMTIENNRIKLDSRDKLHGVRPAVDYLFSTAASIYKDKLLGIILTGMGRDGSQGMESIKKMGGYNIAQDKETSVVYGMPGNAIARGVVDEIMSLEDISINLNKIIKVK